jgi:hypothetical protein
MDGLPGLSLGDMAARLMEGLPAGAVGVEGGVIHRAKVEQGQAAAGFPASSAGVESIAGPGRGGGDGWSRAT